MRVLYLTHRLPYAPNRGDRIRAFYTLQALRGRASVDVVSLVHTPEEAARAGDLAPMADSVAIAPVIRSRAALRAIRSLATDAPLTHALLDSPAMRAILDDLVAKRRPDVVLAYCSGMARFALEPPLAGLPLVVDLVDVDSLKWRALAETRVFPMSWIYGREARVLARFEAVAASRAFATVVVNEREREALSGIARGARLHAVPSGVDFEHLAPRGAPSPNADVVFCGVMNYAPNEEAAVWLAREVWPRVAPSIADARLRIVGAHPTPRVKRLADASARIDVTGEVPDVRPYLWGAAVAVAPLQIARGIQNKVLEAIAAGLPTVVTPAVAAGLPEEVSRACAIAGDPEAFASAIVRHLRMTPAERRALAASVDLSPLGWSKRLAPLVDLVELARQSARQPSR